MNPHEECRKCNQRKPGCQNINTCLTYAKIVENRQNIKANEKVDKDIHAIQRTNSVREKWGWYGIKSVKGMM